MTRIVRPATALVILGACVLLLPATGWAQRWSWPERPENLKVLENVGGEELSSIMRSFTRALGVRCNHCHVGEDGQPLSTFDFVSDANPNKDRAREMLRMVTDIETHLARIEPSAGARVEVGCATCHRGVARPMMLGEELTRSYRDGGVDAALAHYGELHARYEDRGAYDFGPGGLLALADAVHEAGDAAGAIAVLEFAVQEHPASADVRASLGAAVEETGDVERAKVLYREALDLDPRQRHARTRLEALGGE